MFRRSRDAPQIVIGGDDGCLRVIRQRIEGERLSEMGIVQTAALLRTAAVVAAHRRQAAAREA